MDTKSGCGRLDLSAFQEEPARPAWPAGFEDAAPIEIRTWKPAEAGRPDPAPLFEPRPC